MHYSDIQPPKRGSIRQIKAKTASGQKTVTKKTERLDQIDQADEDVVFSTEESDQIVDKIYYSSYNEQKRRFPKALVLSVIAIIAIVIVTYSKLTEHTTITLTPSTTTFDIREKITLSSPGQNQKTEDGTLSYSLLYIPTTDGERNPFAAAPTKATSTSEQVSIALKPVEVIATTTGARTMVYLVNTSNENVSLRATTRIEINNLIYSLPQAILVASTKNAGMFDINTKYKLPGFKGTALYDSLYAVLVTDTTTSSATPDNQDAPPTGSSTLATVPENILSLLPETSVALRKHTIYDTAVDQNAVVTFDKKDLLNVLASKNPGFAAYMEAFKPVADIVTFDVVIMDYEFDTSSNGHPTVFKYLQIEIKPIVDVERAKIAFAGFELAAMEKIATELGSFAELRISNTPFWSKDIAREGKIEVNIEER